MECNLVVVSGTTRRRCPSNVTASRSSERTFPAPCATSTWAAAWTSACTKQATSEKFLIVSLQLMLLYFRCMSVAYSPIGRECRISRFDQRDSRILYDPDFDYYENLVGKRHIAVLHSKKHSTRSILLTVHPRPPARVH